MPTSPSEIASPPSPRTLLINSVLAAVLGSGLMVAVHEVCHLLTGLALGIPGTLYPFGVQHSGTPGQQALMAGSAPAFSLVSGLLLARWQPLRALGGFGQLLWLWFAYSSLMEGIGYLEITPFGAGDTATVASSLGWPSAISWVLFAIGVAGQFLCAWGFAHPVGRIAGRDRASRLATTFWPWLIATVVNLGLSALYLGAAKMDLTSGEVTVIALAGMATIVFAPMALLFSRVSDGQAYEPPRLRTVPLLGLVGTAAMILVNMALTQGLRVG